jgi:plastocyanin
MHKRNSRRLWIAIVGLIMVALLAACGNDNGDDNGNATEPATDMGGAMTVEVSMVDNAFEPSEITVSPGTTVIWTNNGAVAHTATAGERDNPTGMFDSGNVDPGGTFEYTFTDEGTFPYFCSIHPGMDGTVIVSSE